MAEMFYCWRCRIDVPMLNEAEWQEIESLLRDPDKTIDAYKLSRRAAETRDPDDIAAVPALARFNEITGFDESNVNAIWHHRRALYGPACKACGKLLRTPKARFCASCGERK